MGFLSRFMGVLAFFVNIYMFLIFIRIILTWISWMGNGRFLEVLSRITDPYLNWFRRFTFLRVGFMDLSPIAALGVLTLVSRIFSTLSHYGTITLGIILAMVIQVLWGAVSFFLGFLIIILILRLVAHLSRQNLNNPFWRIIATIAQPVLYKISRILFNNRIVNLRNEIIISIVILGLIYLVLRISVSLISVVLARLPI